MTSKAICKLDRSRLVIVTLLGSVIGLVPSGRLGAEQDAVEDDLRGAIPVLGRIIEKNLQTRGVSTGLQWVYLKGRGLLYLGGVDLSDLGGAREGIRPSEMSADDREWENARRETLGQPSVKIDESVRVQGAIDAVRGALTRFAERVPLPGGEEVRVALYDRSSSCMSCHTATARLGSQESRERKLAFSAATLASPFDPTTSSARHHHFRPREALVIDQGGSVFQSDPQQLDDVTVLARVLGKKLARTFPDEYWGFDMQGRAGSLGVTAGDWGPVVILNMTFPLESSDAVPGARKLDLWEETARELRGQVARPPAVDPKTERRRVDASAFLATVKDSIATFGSRVRGLRAGQEIVVAVFGGSTPIVTKSNQEPVFVSPGNKALQIAAQYRVLTASRSRTATSPSYVLRLEATDLLPGPDGRVPDPQEVVGKVRVE